MKLAQPYMCFKNQEYPVIEDLNSISLVPQFQVAPQALLSNNGKRTQMQRLELVKRHGSQTLAFATLQTDAAGVPVLEYFDTDDGYIAYARSSLLGQRIVVLGEPVCAPEKLREILATFTQLYHRVLFVQVGETVGRILEQLGFFVNRFGTETFLDIEDYSLGGRRREDVRTMLNSAVRNGVTVKEQDEVEVSAADVIRVNREWLSTRRVRTGELSFMVRQALHFREPFVRKLYAFAKGRLVGFAYYDPFFRNEKTIGFHAMTNRYGWDAPKGTSYMVDISMVKRLQREGVSQFALGFSPFSQVSATEHFRSNALTKLNFRFDYRFLNRLYNFRGQEQRKRKYRGRVVPLYFASKGKVIDPIVNLWVLCKLSNFSVWSQFCQSLKPHSVP
jgi:lysylphosphatidylglycerol synthetase-like protein (DUF2156 family)